MLSETVRRISVNEKHPSSRLQRYVEERVKQWLNDQDLLRATQSKRPADYEVAFFDEEVPGQANGEVSCLITVQAGETQWRSWEIGESPQAALNKSLENLHVDLKH